MSCLPERSERRQERRAFRQILHISPRAPVPPASPRVRVEAVRGDSSSPSAINTYLSFVGGQSDVHSFKIQSGEKTLKEVIFGNDASEKQSGIRVYADGDANEWSEVKFDDMQK